MMSVAFPVLLAVLLPRFVPTTSARTTSEPTASAPTNRCAPGSVWRGVCEKCPAGFWCDGDSENRCAPAGTYSLSTGASSLSGCDALACSQGFFCPSPGGVRIPCAAGRYSSASGVSLSSDCSNLLCPAGYFCGEGSAAPQRCPRGTFCTAGSSSPMQCSRGFFCAAGRGGESPCPQGRHGARAGLGDATECTVCSTGQICDGTGGPPTLCPAGEYCAVGTASRACPPGHYCPAGSQAPLPCLGGTTSRLVGLKADYECEGEICDAGYYCPPGSVIGLPCPAGASNAAVGLRSVHECDAMTCKAGHYCPPGSESPVPCPRGRFGVPGTVEVDEECAGACPLPELCPAGSAFSCPPGTFPTTEALARLGDANQSNRSSLAAALSVLSKSTPANASLCEACTFIGGKLCLGDGACLGRRIGSRCVEGCVSGYYKTQLYAMGCTRCPSSLWPGGATLVLLIILLGMLCLLGREVWRWEQLTSASLAIHFIQLIWLCCFGVPSRFAPGAPGHGESIPYPLFLTSLEFVAAAASLDLIVGAECLDTPGELVALTQSFPPERSASRLVFDIALMVGSAALLCVALQLRYALVARRARRVLVKAIAAHRSELHSSTEEDSETFVEAFVPDDNDESKPAKSMSPDSLSVSTHKQPVKATLSTDEGGGRQDGRQSIARRRELREQLRLQLRDAENLLDAHYSLTREVTMRESVSFRAFGGISNSIKVVPEATRPVLVHTPEKGFSSSKESAAVVPSLSYRSAKGQAGPRHDAGSNVRSSRLFTRGAKDPKFSEIRNGAKEEKRTTSCIDTEESGVEGAGMRGQVAAVTEADSVAVVLRRLLAFILHAIHTPLLLRALLLAARCNDDIAKAQSIGCSAGGGSRAVGLVASFAIGILVPFATFLYARRVRRIREDTAALYTATLSGVDTELGRRCCGGGSRLICGATPSSFALSIVGSLCAAFREEHIEGGAVGTMLWRSLAAAASVAFVEQPAFLSGSQLSLAFIFGIMIALAKPFEPHTVSICTCSRFPGGDRCRRRTEVLSERLGMVVHDSFNKVAAFASFTVFANAGLVLVLEANSDDNSNEIFLGVGVCVAGLTAASFAFTALQPLLPSTRGGNGGRYNTLDGDDLVLSFHKLSFGASGKSTFSGETLKVGASALSAIKRNVESSAKDGKYLAAAKHASEYRHLAARVLAAKSARDEIAFISDAELAPNGTDEVEVDPTLTRSFALRSTESTRMRRKLEEIVHAGHGTADTKAGELEGGGSDSNTVVDARTALKRLERESSSRGFFHLAHEVRRARIRLT